MLAVKDPAGQPHQNPGTGKVTVEDLHAITLGKRWEFMTVTEPASKKTRKQGGAYESEIQAHSGGPL